MEIVWLAFFLMATIFEIAAKNFLCFFQPQIDFRIQTNFFEKKILHAKFNFSCV